MSRRMSDRKNIGESHPVRHHHDNPFRQYYPLIRKTLKLHYTLHYLPIFILRFYLPYVYPLGDTGEGFTYTHEMLLPRKPTLTHILPPAPTFTHLIHLTTYIHSPPTIPYAHIVRKSHIHDTSLIYVYP